MLLRCLEVGILLERLLVAGQCLREKYGARGSGPKLAFA